MKDTSANNPNFRSLSAIFRELEENLKQKKSAPKIPDNFGAFYVAVTCIIMAYSTLIGVVPILVLYAIWLPKFYYKKTFILRPSKDVVISFALPFLAVISTLWSDYSPTTIYHALEFTSLIICAVIMAKLVSIRALIHGIIIGSTLVLLASLINGNYEFNSYTGTYSLVGLFGSKNQVGLFAEISILFSLLGIFVARQDILFSLITLPTCAIALYLSKSATSVLSLALTFGLLILVYLVTKLPRQFRLFTFTGIAFFLIIGMVGVISMDLHTQLFKSMGKDTTMSGRTILWDQGMAVGLENPLLGHGYSAFWVQGNQRAEQLWSDFNITGRTGFHFHNLYIELLVELGTAGVAIIVWMFLIILCKCLYWSLQRGMVIDYVLPLGISFMFLIRSFAEVDIIGAFNIGSLLFYSILPRLASTADEGHKTAP